MTLKHTNYNPFQAIRSSQRGREVRMLAKTWLGTLSPTTLVHNFRFRLFDKTETLPIPGVYARLLVCGFADLSEFFQRGRRGFDCIRETLERNGTPIRGLKDVLDFGCGCGRITRYWNGFADTHVFGTDMNGYLVETCRRCVPFASIGKNSTIPALDYADRSFDLVYAFSVLTHMDVEAQIAWCHELRRILKPRGVLLLSLHGAALTGNLNRDELAEFTAGRPVVRGSQYPGENLCAAYHPESFVRETLAKGFEVVDAIPEGALGQDLYMLRRTDLSEPKGRVEDAFAVS